VFSPRPGRVRSTRFDRRECRAAKNRQNRSNHILIHWDLVLLCSSAAARSKKAALQQLDDHSGSLPTIAVARLVAHVAVPTRIHPARCLVRSDQSIKESCAYPSPIQLPLCLSARKRAEGPVGRLSPQATRPPESSSCSGGRARGGLRARLCRPPSGDTVTGVIGCRQPELASDWASCSACCLGQPSPQSFRCVRVMACGQCFRCAGSGSVRRSSSAAVDGPAQWHAHCA